MLLPFALQTALTADPEITRVMIERTWLDQVATVGQSLVSVLVLFMLIAATITLFALRRALDELTRLVKSTSADITGAVHDARVVVEEIRNLSSRVRGGADVVRAGVKRARGFVERVKEREGDSDESPAVRERPERPERGDRDREARPPRPFEEQSMAEMNREERQLRKRRRRRRGNDRPPRGSGEERSGGDGGSGDGGSGDGGE